MTEQLRIFAGLQGFISAAGLLALMLYFALATPFGTEQKRWSWLGPVNDWLLPAAAAAVSSATTPRWLLEFSVVVLVALLAGGVLVGSHSRRTKRSPICLAWTACGG